MHQNIREKRIPFHLMNASIHAAYHNLPPHQYTSTYLKELCKAVKIVLRNLSKEFEYSHMHGKS